MGLKRRVRMFKPRVFLSVVLLLILGLSDEAFAGMAGPVTLREVAKLRLQSLSFFLMLLLISAALIRLIWNSLRKDFVRLPHLTYFKSLGLVLLWGLLFVLVLAMISGARELLTPGAWEKSGATYRLKED
jgi:hypothetical protein